jgi:hypothetical protein
MGLAHSLVRRHDDELAVDCGEAVGVAIQLPGVTPGVAIAQARRATFSGILSSGIMEAGS